MHARPYTWVASALLSAFLLGAGSGASQEVGLAYVAGGSGHPELGAPTGVTGHFIVEAAPHWYVDLTLHRVSDEAREPGRVCVRYTPPVTCHTEPVHKRTTVAGFRAGVMRGLDIGGRLRAGLGGGLSFNQVDAESTGIESGMTGDLLEPSGGQLGALGFAALSFRPVPRVPAALTSRFTAHWVRFDTCSGEGQYDPFCSPDTLYELEFGLSWTFAR